MALYLHRSNRSELLLDRLASLPPPLDPMADEIIVVQSRAMERWLALGLAERRGVDAGTRYPFPRAFVDEVLGAVLGEPARAWSPGVLGWALLDELRLAAADRRFAPVARYLVQPAEPAVASADAGRDEQLAARLADVLDQYAVYRPELVLSWEAGAEPDDWQAELWRRCVARLGSDHFPARLAAVRARLGASSATGSTEAVAGLPARVAVFGVSALPPAHLEVLGLLARHVDVHVFLLLPTPHHFADLTAVSGAPADAGGHPLLGALGGVTTELLDLLEDLSARLELRVHEHDEFVAPTADSLLTQLQADLLDVRAPGPTPSRGGVELHQCHTPQRELEVLRDRLIEWFRSDATLGPHDVLVLVPDVERYAPLVDAVLERGGAEPTLPFRVADRVARAGNGLAAALARLLALVRGRVGASDVMDLLALPGVRRRYGLDEDARELARGWLEDAAVRWGLDGGHRRERGVPPLPANTWSWGLGRLALGVAMGDAPGVTFAGLTPAHVRGLADVDALAGLALLVDDLATTAAEAREEATVEQWATRLRSWAERFVQLEPDDAWQLVELNARLDAAREEARVARFDGLVTLGAIEERLLRWLDGERRTGSFLAGAITVAAMLPMRSIPFRVVAVLGLDDGRFPRTSLRPSFDRLSDEHRRGDREPRAEDRLLFLETILSARERLHLSWVGRSLRDNSELPPSPVVAEVADTLTSMVGPLAAAGVLFHHRLHAFADDYFRGTEPGREPEAADAAAGPAPSAATDAAALPRGSSSADARAARAAASPRSPRPPLLRRPMSAPADAPLSLADVERVLVDPARALLERLGVKLARAEASLSDRQPLDLDALERWELQRELAEIALGPGGPAAADAVGRGSGRLPPGTLGEVTLKPELEQAQAIAEAVRRAGGADAVESRLVTIELPDGALSAELLLSDGAAVAWSVSRDGSARDWLTLWLRHLARSAAPGLDAVQRRSVFVAPDTKGAKIIVRQLSPVEPDLARAVLGRLWRAAGVALRRPIALVGAPSWVAAKQLSRALTAALAGASDVLADAAWLPDAAVCEKARSVALVSWLQGDFGGRPPAADDPAHRLVFDSRAPMREGFRYFDDDALEATAPAPDFLALARDAFAAPLALMEADGG